MGDMEKARLESLNKARTRGPNGRRLPSTKSKKKAPKESEDSQQSSDSNENIIITAKRNSWTLSNNNTNYLHNNIKSDIVAQSQPETSSEPDPEYLSLGRIDSKDFDKIWFIRVPENPVDSSFAYQPDNLPTANTAADVKAPNIAGHSACTVAGTNEPERARQQNQPVDTHQTKTGRFGALTGQAGNGDGGKSLSHSATVPGIEVDGEAESETGKKSRWKGKQFCDIL